MNSRRSIRRALARVGELFYHGRRERELAEELATHLALAAAEYERAGLPPEEARRRARIKLGGLDAAAEACRDRRGLRWLDELAQDLRFGLRQLRRSPGFTAVAVLTLALGIGVNAAIFSLLDKAFFRPLPYPHAARLLWLTDENPRLGLRRQPVSAEEVEAWQQGAKPLLVGIVAGVSPEVVTCQFRPGRLRYATFASASGNLFSMLGVVQWRGRLLNPADAQAHHALVAVVSYSFWQRQFQSRPLSSGLRFRVLDFFPPEVAVVGVLPPGFRFGAKKVDFWIEYNALAAHPDPRHNLWAIALPRPGVKPSRLQAALNTMDAGLVRSDPQERGWQIAIEPLQHHFFSRISLYLVLLFAASGLVLLIVFANLANLFLARSETRRREFSIRTALGAGAGRLARQRLAENFLLAFFGIGFGLGLAGIGLKLLLVVLPPSLVATFQLLHPALFTMPELGWALLVTIAWMLLFAFLPAHRAKRFEYWRGLSGRVRGDRRGFRLQPLLMMAEMAMALSLLLTAGLFLRSFHKLVHAPLGFQRRHLISVGLDLQPPFPRKYGYASAAFHAFLRELLPRLRALSGVAGVAMASNPPLTPAAQSESAAFARAVDLSVVSPGYFRMMGARVLAGRVFNASDTNALPMRVVLTRNAAKRFFPGRNPVGRRLRWYRCRFTRARDPDCLVIGVVEDTRQTGLANTEPLVYESIWQEAFVGGNLIVRARRPLAELLAQLDAVMDGVAAASGLRMSIEPAILMRAQIAAAAAVPRFRSTLLLLFAVLALGLAMLGIFGVTHYFVQRSIHDIAVRMLLGASPGRVMADFLRKVLLWTGTGALLGWCLAWLASRAARSLLFEISPQDPWTYALATLALMVAALVAVWLPARSAAKLDPLTALRYE